jgi:hypothetical protein
MNFTLITPTCDRPEAFKLCKKWINRQTLPFHQWFVLDDGLTPADCASNQTQIFYSDTHGRLSLYKKLQSFFVNSSHLITGDLIAFIEDDDWYSPTYLEQAAQRIGNSNYEMIGEGHALYYNVRNRSWINYFNEGHASLCQTVIKKSVINSFIPHLSKLIESGTLNFCLDIWRENKDVNRKLFLPKSEESHNLIGIKGLYAGYQWHRSCFVQKNLDPNLVDLRRLIGEDAENYMDYFNKIL